jgi:hypothetical protein
MILYKRTKSIIIEIKIEIAFAFYTRVEKGQVDKG